MARHIRPSRSGNSDDGASEEDEVEEPAEHELPGLERLAAPELKVDEPGRDEYNRAGPRVDGAVLESRNWARQEPRPRRSI
jgi:hypothetical protein